MIELATDDPLLARFARDLDAQASTSVEIGPGARPYLDRFTAEDIEHARLA